MNTRVSPGSVAVSRRQTMAYGAELADGGEGVRFRLWAPNAADVTLCLERNGRGEASGVEQRPMPACSDDGWRELFVEGIGAGAYYRFAIDGGLWVPDPASRFQPEDVHGPSEVIDPRGFRWTATDWRGRPWEEAVVYELHVGTFTPEGTFRAALAKLPYLVELGVTAVELMPVADFPGSRNWGYDGVSLFAPDSRYGRPDDLKALVDEAHRLGLMVILDVVYNHFGPEGNYLHVYAKRFFNEAKHTPWGAAINFDAEGSSNVRRFFVENALYWVNEFFFDGLRLDAVHAIEDASSPDILEDIAAAVRSSLPPDRHVHLVLENDDNAARYLTRTATGEPRQYVAQWNDDIHHAFHVLLTGETRGYYSDYADNPTRHLARCLSEGFAYQGEPSEHRDGVLRGEPSAALPPTAFVNFLQNHDQIGNRAMGDRLASLVCDDAVRAGLAALLLAPSPPLLFMGEEWASRRPFLFFCDLGADLQPLIRDGRRKEFASFPEFADPAMRERIPDPTDAETFQHSMLDWAEAERDRGAAVLALTKRLLKLRQERLVPLLAGIDGHCGRVLWTGGGAQGNGSLSVLWRLAGGARLTLLANLSPETVAVPDGAPPSTGALLFATHEAAVAERAEAVSDPLPPWSVAWFLDTTASEALA